jgi:hypothetical protein
MPMRSANSARAAAINLIVFDRNEKIRPHEAGAWAGRIGQPSDSLALRPKQTKKDWTRRSSNATKNYPFR